ncbi:hypothetical protein V8E51_014494 [Hyaloscypha variabilis]
MPDVASKARSTRGVGQPVPLVHLSPFCVQPANASLDDQSSTSDAETPGFKPSGQRSCLRNDESALHRASVKLTWTTGPSTILRVHGAPILTVVVDMAPGSPAQACLRMFRVADQTAWGLHLQSDSTLALEHSQRTLRLESQNIVQTVMLHLVTMFRLPRQHCCPGLSEWRQQLTVDWPFIHLAMFPIQARIFPSVVFRAANHRDLEAACCWLAGCFAAASAAEEWNGWRLIHVRQVHPAAASSIDAPVHSELASLWMLGVWTREPLISSTKYPGDRWQSAACVRACVQAWIRIGMSIANAFPE